MSDTTVFFCLKNMFIDNWRKRKLETIELIDNYATFTDDYDFEDDYFKQKMLDIVEDLPYFERKLLKETQIISQRKLSLKTEIPFIVINQNIKKTKVKLWDELKKLKDSETQSQL
jgi:DNA-directed RNA polymerase specialized sigma24 family protein